MTVPEAIQAVVAGRRLSEQQASDAASAIMAGQATPSQIAGLLVALRMRGETADEIAGFVRAARAAATPVTPRSDGLLDTCGTGGDGSGTFNISTVTGFVAAAAGCRVAKHGNRSVSSRCGSADVLTELGARVDLPAEQVAACIDEVGFGFLHAPSFHPGARHAVAPRREIGIRTIFNAIGPLVHPAGARRQLVGVYDAGLTEVMAEALRRQESEHCLIVHGLDGLDEISLSATTRVTELRTGQIATFTIRATDFGLAPAGIDALAGGDSARNADILRAVLSGERGPCRDVVLINSGAAIHVGGRAESIAEGVRLAADAIDSGAALSKLRAFIEFTRSRPA